VAVSDYMRAVPDQIRPWVPQEFAPLGTDGFGFSDTRPAARRHFAVDGPSIATRVLQQLALRGRLSKDAPADAIERYRLHDVTAGTTGTAGGES
jgi:pyruvate dehydrogenase E1 component